MQQPRPPSDQAVTSASLSLEAALAYQSIIREMLQHENELINQRLGWLFTLQGLLFGAMSLTWKDNTEVVLILGTIGVLSCVSVGYTLAVSARTTKELIELAQTYKRPHPNAIFPPTVGARTPSLQWLFPARILPWVLGLAWIAVLALQVRGIVEDSWP